MVFMDNGPGMDMLDGIKISYSLIWLGVVLTASGQVTTAHLQILLSKLVPAEC